MEPAVAKWRGLASWPVVGLVELFDYLKSQNDDEAAASRAEIKHELDRRWDGRKQLEELGRLDILSGRCSK